MGGIQRYRPIRLDLLARDAACAASQRTTRLAEAGVARSALGAETRQIRVLLGQARAAVPAAVIRGDIVDPAGVEIEALLRGEELDAETVQRLCGRLESISAERDRSSTETP